MVWNVIKQISQDPMKKKRILQVSSCTREEETQVFRHSALHL